MRSLPWTTTMLEFLINSMTMKIPFAVWLYFKYILNENSWDVTLKLTDGLVILILH